MDPQLIFRIRCSLAELLDAAAGHAHCYEMDKVKKNATDLFNDLAEPGLSESAKRFDEAMSDARILIRALADEHTGRKPLALLDVDLGDWAEGILAHLENREPQEPSQ